MEVTLELSDLVVMQIKLTMPYIPLKKNLVTGLPVAIILIKYNSNNLEENKEKRRRKFILSLLRKNLILKTMKILLILDCQMY